MLLFDPPAIQSTHKIRCRQIVESDFAALINLLTRGFARTSREYWLPGFSRWRMLPTVQGMPRYGYVLESEVGLVGAVLLISSMRGGHIVSNLSNWYVEPAWRVHSPLLISVTTRLRQVTYLSTSPPHRAWRTLQAHGFKPYNFGRSTVAVLPGKGRVSETLTDDLPEARLLRDHREMGAVSLAVEKDGLVSPFVFKPRYLERPRVKVMELIYCRDTADFRRCAPALSRHFLKSGGLGFVVDGRFPAAASRYDEGRELRYYKGPQPPPLNDLAYTVKSVFG